MQTVCWRSRFRCATAGGLLALSICCGCAPPLALKHSRHDICRTSRPQRWRSLAPCDNGRAAATVDEHSWRCPLRYIAVRGHGFHVDLLRTCTRNESRRSLYSPRQRLQEFLRSDQLSASRRRLPGASLCSQRCLQARWGTGNGTTSVPTIKWRGGISACLRSSYQ
jgi:hypothetical protein